MTTEATARFTGNKHQERTDATNAKVVKVFKESLDIASVAADSVAEEALTVTGVDASGRVLAVIPPASLGLGIGYARVTAADEITVAFVNPTAGAVDPAADQDFEFVVLQES